MALVSSVLYLSVVLSSSALADYNPSTPSRPKTPTGSWATRARYNPRNPSRPKTPTGSWASRGCETTQNSKAGNPSEGLLTLLAPRNHIGLTGSSHPTFVWFVPEQKPYPVEFTLFEYSREQGRGQKLQTIALQSSPGRMTLSLPKDQPGLTVGKTYVWQVALICSRNRPSRNIWTETVIEVSQLPTDLTAALAVTTEPLKRAELYAQAGFWYEALAETLKSPTAKPFRQTLVTDLGKLESPEQRKQLEAVLAIDP
jgi:Domain of Unknown Function (DUF928)